VDLPAEMEWTIARQAEGERERRAKVIHAEGEAQAAGKLAAAANMTFRHRGSKVVLGGIRNLAGPQRP